MSSSNRFAPKNANKQFHCTTNHNSELTCTEIPESNTQVDNPLFIVKNIKAEDDSSNIYVSAPLNVTDLTVDNNATVGNDITAGHNVIVGNNLRIVKADQTIDMDGETTKPGHIRARVKGRFRATDNSQFDTEIEVGSLVTAISDASVGGTVGTSQVFARHGISAGAVSARDYLLLDNSILSIKCKGTGLKITPGNINLDPSEFLSKCEAASPLPILRISLPISMYSVLKSNPAPLGGSDGRIPAKMTLSDRYPKQTFVCQTPIGNSLAQYDGDIAIRARGGSSLNTPKRNWNIQLRSSTGKERSFGLLDGTPGKTFWVGGMYLDPSYMRDHIGCWLQAVVRQSTNVWSPTWQYAELIIDDIDVLGQPRTNYGGLVGIIESFNRATNRLNLHSREGVFFQILRADECSSPNPLLGQPSLDEPGGVAFGTTNSVARFWSKYGLWGLKLTDITAAGINPPTGYKAPEATVVYEFDYPTKTEILSPAETVRRDFWIQKIRSMEADLAPFVGLSIAQCDAGQLYNVFDTYFDVDNLVDHYINAEIMYSGDTYIERGIYAEKFSSKFKIIKWDHDQSSGNYNYSLDGTPDDPTYPAIPTYNTRIFQGFLSEQKNKRGPMGVHSYQFWFDLIPKSTLMLQKINQRWLKLRDLVCAATGQLSIEAAIDKYIVDTMNLIQIPATRDFEKWKLRFLSRVGSTYNDVVTNTTKFSGDRMVIAQDWFTHATYLQDWMYNRVSFINNYWNTVPNCTNWALALRPAPVDNASALVVYKNILTFNLKATTTITQAMVGAPVFGYASGGDGGLGGYTQAVKTLIYPPPGVPPTTTDFIVKWAIAINSDLNSGSNPAVGASGLWYGPLVTSSTKCSIETPIGNTPFLAEILKTELHNISPSVTGSYDQIGLRIKVLKSLLDAAKPYYTHSLKDELYIATVWSKTANIDKAVSLAIKFVLMSFISFGSNIFRDSFGKPSLSSSNTALGGLNTNIVKQLRELGVGLSVQVPNYLIQLGLEDSVESLDDGTGTFRDYRVFDARLTRVAGYPGTPLGTVTVGYPFEDQMPYYNNGEFVKGESYSSATFIMDASSAYQNGFRIRGGVGVFGLVFSGIKTVSIPL